MHAYYIWVWYLSLQFPPWENHAHSWPDAHDHSRTLSKRLLHIIKIYKRLRSYDNNHVHIISMLEPIQKSASVSTEYTIWKGGKLIRICGDDKFFWTKMLPEGKTATSWIVRNVFLSRNIRVQFIDWHDSWWVSMQWKNSVLPCGDGAINRQSHAWIKTSWFVSGRSSLTTQWVIGNNILEIFFKSCGPLSRSCSQGQMDKYKETRSIMEFSAAINCRGESLQTISRTIYIWIKCL